MHGPVWFDFHFIGYGCFVVVLIILWKIVVIWLMFNTEFKINILDLDIFVGGFVRTFFVPAILVQAICLLGESTCTHVPDATLRRRIKQIRIHQWMTRALNNTIWKLQSSTDFPALCDKINISPARVIAQKIRCLDDYLHNYARQYLTA